MDEAGLYSGHSDVHVRRRSTKPSHNRSCNWGIGSGPGEKSECQAIDTVKSPVGAVDTRKCESGSTSSPGQPCPIPRETEEKGFLCLKTHTLLKISLNFDNPLH